MIGALYGSLMGIARGNNLAEERNNLSERISGQAGNPSMSPEQARQNTRDEMRLSQVKIQSDATRAMKESSDKMLQEEFQRQKNSVF